MAKTIEAPWALVDVVEQRREWVNGYPDDPPR